MNVSLAPELEKFITEEIKSGKYSSAEEVIREGLLREHEELEQKGSTFDTRTPQERAKTLDESLKSHDDITGPEGLDDSRESICRERENSQL